MIDRELILKLLEKAKEMLIKDGKLYPISFIIKGHLMSLAPAIPTEVETNKYRNMAILGGFARGTQADFVVALFDGAAKHYDTPEQAKYAMENPDTESPLSYPKSMRQECVIAQVVDFKTRKSYASLLPYSGDHPNFKFEEPTEMVETGGAMADYAIKGWDMVEEGIQKGDLPENSVSMEEAQNGEGLPE